MMCRPTGRGVIGLLACMALSMAGRPATAQCNRPGPDVIVGDLIDISNYPSNNGIEAYAVGTTSCNVGNQDLLWIANNNQHPVIGQTLYRLKNGRFEQIGQSWLKHGFTALTENVCGCGCNGHGGSVLGVGCSDPYCCGLNGSQGGLGPKWQVNAHTGAFTYPFADGSPNPGEGDIYKRLQVPISELDPGQNGGGLYFVEGHYVTPDDAAANNQNNNASYRRVNVGGGGSAWTLSLTGTTQREQPALRAWQDNDAAVVETDVQISGDGLVIVAAKATSLGGGLHHYEYAVQNLNSDRCIGTFSIPLPPGVSVFNAGFHDVPYHSGEPFSGADWPATITSNSISWATQTFAQNNNANAIRWNTTYNFRFDTNATPGTINATLGLFKPGAPTSVLASTAGPLTGVPLDCNTNGTDDLVDISSGRSHDCNTNNLPDECESFAVQNIGATLLAGGFESPVYVCAPRNDFGRLFVVEQSGRIKIRDLLGGTTLGTPFIDLSTLISAGGERGLLGMAFHPNYANNGHFFVNYTNTAGNTVIARYTANAPFASSNTANAGSAVILKTITQDFANHNGGCLQFGPDGYLYIGMGDGGSGNDPNNRAQDTGTLLGKMLRLDVDNPGNGYIPPTNPFVGAGNPLDEIWAIGMRNPWRFSFDRQTGDMYIGDVGQNAREEINFEPAGSPGGRNYGWRCMEGTECTGLSGCTCNSPLLTLPILDYAHNSFPSPPCISESGGYVYRGCNIPSLAGTYFYADYCVNFIRTFRYVNGTVTDQQDRSVQLGNISAPVSFGEDASGELYIVSYLGNIYKIVPVSAPVCGNGVTEAGEQCDDANTTAGDGCFNCQIEASNNDTCANAIAVCAGATITADNNSATNDGSANCGNSTTAPDVWFKYTPTVNGTITVSTCGTNDMGGVDAGMDTVLSAHSACPGTTANQLTCNDDWGGGGSPANACSGIDLGTNQYDSSITVAGIAGRTYYFRVAGYGGGRGTFMLNVAGPTCAIQRDCNTNGIDDTVELVNGAADCNSNNTPDACDIRAGTSYDCARNGVPDECETAPANYEYLRSVVPPLNIPDNNTNFVSDVFDVPDHATISDLNMGLRIVHTYNGDLIVRISHGATTVTVIDRPGRTTTGNGFNNDGFNIVLDDEGAGGPIETRNVAGGVVSPPSYTPNNPLSAFDGQDMFGTWTVGVSDRAGQDIGTLNEWRLIISAQTPPQPCPADCNTNGTADAVEIADGSQPDCNSNAVPDICDLALGTSQDCDGGPVGVRAGGQVIIQTSCFGCHNNDGSGGSGFPGPNIRNRSRVFIADRLLPPTDHPGGAHPEFDQQDFADLEAFLADGGSRGRPDGIPDECEAVFDCDTDGIRDACELENATQTDANYNGIPDNCEAPSNNNCANAATINLGATGFSTINATTDGPAEPGSCVKFGDTQVNQDIWYVFTPACYGTLTLSTCNAANFDTKIAVYAGPNCPTASSALACQDDTANCGTTTTLSLNVVQGQPYLIRMGGYLTSTGTGTLTLSLTCQQPNDNCANAIAIVDGDTAFSTVGATTDGPAEPGACVKFGDTQVNQDTWYLYQATCTGDLRLTTCNNANFDTKIAVYGGPVCPTTAGAIACRDDSEGCGTTTDLTLPVVQGQQYLIRVGGFLTATGSGILSVSCSDPGNPTAAIIATPNPAACGQNVVLDGSGSSHSNPNRGIVSFEWDLDNDGQYDDASGVITNVAFGQFGSYTIGLRVTDNNVPARTDTESLVVQINLGNAAPSAAAGGPYEVQVGGSVSLDGSASSDPNASCGDSISQYAWDLDNDGQYDDAAGVAPLVTWAQLQALGVTSLGVHVIGLRVTDEFGLSGTAAGSIRIRCAPPATGDMNGDGLVDGDDIAVFVEATIAASTDPLVVCPGDFSGNSVLDVADVPGFTAALVD